MITADARQAVSLAALTLEQQRQVKDLLDTLPRELQARMTQHAIREVTRFAAIPRRRYRD